MSVRTNTPRYLPKAQGLICHCGHCHSALCDTVTCMADLDIAPDLLSHVRWIGGGSGGAKSTVARALAVKHDAYLFDTDAAMQRHASLCDTSACPRLFEFLKMNMDERWLFRTPEEMLESFHWFQGEGFQFIIDDLLILPRVHPVIVEGFRLLPRLVAPLLHDRRHAHWLLPTPEFRRLAFRHRGTTWDIPNKTSDPQRALKNLLARDALFTERLQQDVGRLGLYATVVDGSLTERELCGTVEEQLFG